MATVEEVILAADAVLRGTPAPEGQPDARWQAIIAVGEYVASDPEPVWSFVSRWGRHEQPDLRTAMATVLLEHLLKNHFALIFPRVEKLAAQDDRFADTFRRCWKFGQAAEGENAARFDRLARSVGA
jgi:hypothetical protein